MEGKPTGKIELSRPVLVSEHETSGVGLVGELVAYTLLVLDSSSALPKSRQLSLELTHVCCARHVSSLQHITTPAPPSNIRPSMHQSRSSAVYKYLESVRSRTSMCPYMYSHKVPHTLAYGKSQPNRRLKQAAGERPHCM